MSGWTDERVAKLVEMWAEGKSGSEIAKALGGVTRNAAIGKLGRLHLLGTRSAEVALNNVRRLTPGAGNLKRVSRGGAGVVRAAKERTAKPRAEPKPKAYVQRNVGTRSRTSYTPPAPLIVDASLAKPWTERSFGECAYPISGEGADAFSCCQPTAATYCRAHAALMFVPWTEKPSKLMRLARYG